MKPYVKLAGIAKNEAAYLPQWIHHHLYFGFDEVEIWVNNTTDNSIEILERLKQHYPQKVSYREVDDFFAEKSRKNKNFQTEAYAAIFEDSKKNGQATHIFFLDIDEFWTPRDFSSDLQSYLQDPYIKSADAASFLWYFDTPDSSRTPFTFPFELQNLVHRNRHVKTLLKLTDRVEILNIHNHVIKDGNYVTYDGSQFENIDPEQAHYSKITHELFNSHTGRVDDFFILHQIYRSQQEYLASLLRGRQHVNLQSGFKDNRYGYIPEIFSHPACSFEIPQAALDVYRESYISFVCRSNIESQLRDAQSFVIQRFHEAVEHIRADTGILQKNHISIRGLRINDLISEPIVADTVIYAIDAIQKSEDGSELIISGWAFDKLSRHHPEIVFFNHQGQAALPVKSTHKRPDVKCVHPEADTDCGFNYRIRREKLEALAAGRSIADLQVKFRVGHMYQRIQIDLK